MPIQLERLAFVIGIILMFVSIYMLAPMIADYAAGNDDWKAFAHAFAISGTLAGLTIMVTVITGLAPAYPCVKVS